MTAFDGNQSPIVNHVSTSIAPSSSAHARAAEERIARILGSAQPASTLERLAARLAGAQHSARPRAKPRLAVVVAGDHGRVAPVEAEGPQHPTVVAAREMASGTAGLSRVARTTDTPIVLVEGGVAQPAHFPTSAIAVGGTLSGNWEYGSAMTIEQAWGALEAGIALAVSLSEQGVALLSVGSIGEGSYDVAAALFRAMNSQARATGAELLANFCGPQTGVLAGLMLGSASMNIPVIIDSYGTGSGAVIAFAITPAVAGYLIASHRGSEPMPGMLAHLGLQPMFDVGLGRGDGTGAAMVLPFADQVASLLQE